ncbi:MAG TPA: patatin-like phospholipase family protein [Longimicrobiales bacterium]
MLGCAFLAVSLVVARPLNAQHALVLSGGGARGLAHAGAIVALEELGYRPSLVVGTSMGAIIGALYGAGYTAEQIRTIVAGENWLELMIAAPIPVGADRELVRPLLGFGISRGRFYGSFLSAPGIDQRLIELLFDAGVRARNDFDALPVPYRAVTADLATGRELVLASGDLPRAVRASMAVPGAFAPVRWGDRILIDGGVANNLPVSVARSLTDRPVIAIDVLRPREEVEERSALDLAMRSLRLLIENARPAAEPDILVLPPMAAGFAETSFPADATDVLERGYRSVLEQVAPVPEQPAVRRTAGPAPERLAALRIEGADSAAARLIRRIMGSTVREYDPARIIEGASSLYRTGLFQSVWPRVEFPQGTADPVLVVEVTPIASTSVSGGARWDNDVGGSGWASLRQSLSLNTPVELRLVGSVDQFGHEGSLSASFFSALVPGMVWNGGANGVERRVRLVGADTLGDPRVRRLGGWLGGELRGPIPNWLFSTSIRAEHVRVDTVSLGWAAGPFARIARAPAPDRVVGIDPLLEAEVRGGDVEYQRARVRLSQTAPLGPLRVGLLLHAAAASRGAPPDARPTVDHDLAPWLDAGTLPHRLAGGAGVDAALPILLNGHARVRLRALVTADEVTAPRTTDEWQLGGEIGAIWPTVLGPVSVGATVAQRTQWRFNLGIGSTF